MSRTRIETGHVERDGALGGDRAADHTGASALGGHRDVMFRGDLEDAAHVIARGRSNDHAGPLGDVALRDDGDRQRPPVTSVVRATFGARVEGDARAREILEQRRWGER